MLTLTDMFCGAGGSSTGAELVPGVEVATAMNHWQLAIDTHHTNHQNTRHICADISQTDPRYIPTTDLLWASPECTNHSVAKGVRRVTWQDSLLDERPLPDEAAQRSRATMWDVPRFAEVHRYRAIVTENVVDARKWIMFDAWLHAMTSLGYKHRTVYLNSMHAQMAGLPAPQSRDRMYVVFWRSGDRAPDLEQVTRPRAWCPDCGRMVDAVQAWKKPDRPWGRYRAQYVYRCPHFECRNRIVEPGWLPAAAAIDWSIQGTPIGERKRPLSSKTLSRIKEGLKRYGLTRPLVHRNYTPRPGCKGAGLTRSVDEPLGAITTSDHHSLLVPVEGRYGKRAQSSGEPLRTQTTRLETGLLTPYYGASRSATSTDRPMGALTTVDRFALVTLRGHNAPKPVREPMDTVCAGGNHHGLMEITDDDVNSCRFRMLEPDEVKRGMAFPGSYVMLGTHREQVRMAGNAVTPPAARDLLATVAEALS